MLLFLSFIVNVAQIIGFYSRLTTSENPEVLQTLLDVGRKGNPGISTTMTQKGLNYMADIGIRVINQEIRKINLDGTINQPLPANVGTVKISNMKITKYWPPTKYSIHKQPPNSFKWVMNNFGVQ